MFLFFFILFFRYLGWSSVRAIEVLPKSISGTESLDEALTSKQLAIQRWFAQLTFLQDDEDWTGWGDAINDLHCDGNTCIRYEISGLVYAAAVLGSKTPAYTQLSELTIQSAIRRMISKPVWQYIEIFDDFTAQPTFPDPVAYKNIMYSGHLAQMIALYETVSGDFSFSVDGWQFEWGEDSAYPAPIPYNTSLLLQRIHAETRNYDIAGVPCEPDSIFIVCNNFAMNAFLLHDAVHNSSFARNVVREWQRVVKGKGRNRLPDVNGADNNFFNLDYLIKPIGVWEPIATVGSDVWALAWMRTWWMPERDDDEENMLQDAFESVRSSSCWILDDGGETSPSMAYLHPGSHKSRIFPFSDEITSSFYPMIHKQFANAEESADAPSPSAVYQYFEQHYSRWFDSDGDGVKDSYQYNTALAKCSDRGDVACVTGDYSVWATANLAIGMVIPPGDNNYLRRLIQGEFPAAADRRSPKVLSVEFPHVFVQRAVFLPPGHNRDSADCPARGGDLQVTLLPGDNAPRSSSHIVTIDCGCVVAGDRLGMGLSVVVTLNDQPFNDWSMESNRLRIVAPGWGGTEGTEVTQKFVVTYSD